MIFYRGKDNNEREGELNSIIELAEQSDGLKKSRLCENLKVLKSPDFLRPFRCVGILYILYNMTSVPIIAKYTDTFLEVMYIKISAYIDISCLDIDKICSEQLSSVNERTSIPTEQLAIIHGTFKLAASLLGPMIFTKFRKKTAFIMCGTLAALSLAPGKRCYHINLNDF